MVYRLLPAAEGPFSSCFYLTTPMSREVKRISQALFRQKQRYTLQHSIPMKHHSCTRPSFVMFMISNLIFVIEHVIISRIQALKMAAGCDYVFTAINKPSLCGPLLLVNYLPQHLCCCDPLCTANTPA